MYDIKMLDKLDYRIVFVAPEACSDITPSVCSPVRIKPPPEQ
ncbi:hypothetical protein MBGDC06_00532 [Thermoplasmatales archaeon SCGC AB-539-C06]|nr:hypothetical protein MBGDC06_00532 [Thermoplasmatales archaeon SCGC AB-539-C06]